MFGRVIDVEFEDRWNTSRESFLRLSGSKKKVSAARWSRRFRAQIEFSTPEKCRISSNECPPKCADVTDVHSTEISPLSSRVSTAPAKSGCEHGLFRASGFSGSVGSRN